VGKKGLIYCATDDMLYPAFDLGADGAIAAIQFQRRIKEAISILGGDVGIARSPISRATNEESEKIRREVMKL